MAEPVPSVPGNRGQPSRNFVNATHTYVNGKVQATRLHPSMARNKGVIRLKRVDDPEDYEYMEGTNEPASP